MSGYQRINFKDQVVERPKTYDVTNNPDGSITLIESFGNVEELGTPINQENMNHIEDGIDAVSFSKFNVSSVYQKDEFVTKTENGQLEIYRSLINNNFGNELTDASFWEKVNFSGGGQYIGQTIFSLDPLYEDGLHLLDGALLQVGGIYDQFINDYISKLYTTNPERFCTEQEYQTSLSAYGVCGKYVYTEGVSVRLPKVGNYLYTKQMASTLPVKGNGKALGITNGTGQGVIGKADTNMLMALGRSLPQNLNQTGSSTTLNGYTNFGALGVVQDGNKSGIIADLSNITQPLEGYYYVVVATGTKTQIDVDIDNIATDLNGKADTDLSNVTDQGKILMSSMGMPSSKKIDLTLGASGASYTAPADGWFFMRAQMNNTYAFIEFDNKTSGLVFSNGINSGSPNLGSIAPCKKGDVMRVYYLGLNTSYTPTFRFHYAVGSESEAE